MYPEQLAVCPKMKHKVDRYVNIVKAVLFTKNRYVLHLGPIYMIQFIVISTTFFITEKINYIELNHCICDGILL